MVSHNKDLAKTLDQILGGLVTDSKTLAGISIERMVLDSRTVEPGDLFVAVPGLNTDGRNYIRDAIEAGANAVIWESEQGAVPIPIAWRVSSSGTRIPLIAIDELSSKVGSIADRFYHEPSKKMFVVGITGTNGKTSCSHFVAQALNPDKSCGVIGTIGWGFPGDLQTSSHTTPDVIKCHSWLSDLQQRGSQAVAMEVSSHALDQGRVDEVHFDCAVFTNLSHEHLDYHGTLENYASAKSKLFEIESVKSAVINADDELGQRLITTLSDKLNVVSYGFKDTANRPGIYADEISQTESGLSFVLHAPGGAARVSNHIYGLFNIHNLLATAGVMIVMGYSVEDIASRLSSLEPINGRLSIVSIAGKATVVIDYAHTPDALKQALTSLREHFSGETWCVFGCGGDRDRAKRPLMGRIAEQYADHVVVTSDNPRSESPGEIIAEIVAGMSSEKQVIREDRRDAIKYALSNASSNDIVLIAGKGHENYQLIGKTRIEFNDALVAKEILEKRNNG